MKTSCTDNPYFICLKELCKTCYNKKEYKSLKLNNNNKLKFCEKDNCTNCRPIYVNAKNYEEYLRDFQNNSQHPTNKIEHCKRENCLNSYEKCTFAHNNFEYFVWNRMITLKNKKVSEIFETYFQPYIYVPSENCRSTIRDIPANINHHKEELSVPQSELENKLNQQKNRNKIYFCSFCLNYVTSEPDIDSHVEGAMHKKQYEADKKRKWYFKMPNQKNITLCQNYNCTCDGPHSENERKEMIARIKFRKFLSSFDMPEEMLDCLEKKISILPKWMKITIPKFPNRIECYNPSMEIIVTLKILNSGFHKLQMFLSDDESRPYFKFIKIDENQVLQNCDQLMTIDLRSYSKKEITFGIQFSPKYSSTYRQRIIFRLHNDNKTFTYCERIRVDIGTSKHLQIFKDNWEKYSCVIANQTDVRLCIPFNVQEKKISLLNEDLLYNVTSIPTNPDWINATVENYNYCNWMRDMMVLEELEQRLILSRIDMNFKVKVRDNFRILETTYYVYDGQLYGIVLFSPEHDFSARKLITENVMTGYFTVIENPQNRFEFQLVNLFKDGIESRSVTGFTMRLSRSTVEILNLNSDTELNVKIFFDFDRFAFDCRHKSLNNIPKYDKLAYNPLSCPFFTRLPDGETESDVSFTPHKKLNEEQRRLPLLVLRKLNPNEIALPFVLNGAFGTGKTLLIAETVIEILKNDPDPHILICTRSYSAAEKYLEIFTENFENFCDRIKLIQAKANKSKFKNMTIYNDVIDAEIDNSNFQSISVLITTLDNAANFLTKFIKSPIIDLTFQYIFLDEAAQVLEAHAIIVYQFGNRNSKFVFAGDVYQTNAEIYNKKLEKFSVPIIRRLYEDYDSIPEYKICLIEVYRTHPDIVNLLSTAIYYPIELKPSKKPSYPLKSMKFYDVDGSLFPAIFDENFGSFQNETEAEKVVNEIEKLISDNDWIKPGAILVCSPFYSQIRLIREKVKRARLFGINVELPSGIQGQEYGFVFLSPVLTQSCIDTNLVLHHTFHDSKNLINVVISRAKHFVEVVGDLNSLLTCATGKQWELFVEMCL